MTTTKDINKHTPGPWYAVDEQWRSQIVGVGSDRFLAEVFHVEDKSGWLERWENGKANAALIAAAPDLLEACQAALEWMQEYRNKPTAPISLCRDAIAKATFKGI